MCTEFIIRHQAQTTVIPAVHSLEWDMSSDDEPDGDLSQMLGGAFEILKDEGASHRGLQKALHVSHLQNLEWHDALKDALCFDNS